MNGFGRQIRRHLERFPRQYTWFSEMLLNLIDQSGKGGLANKLAALGRDVGASMKAQLPGKAGETRQIEAIAKVMMDIGYDAAAKKDEGGRPFIEAHNCVFHRLASAHPEVCSFDIALLSASSGCNVEHGSCMVRAERPAASIFTQKKTRQSCEAD